MKKFSGLIASSILAGGLADAAYADDLIAAKNIRAGSAITASDIVTPDDRKALRRAVDVIGMETDRTYYQGQPIDEGNLRPRTLIKRNAVVQMEYAKGPMMISAEGRALDRGALGDRIRVMNLDSKRIVTVVVVGADAVKAQL